MVSFLFLMVDGGGDGGKIMETSQVTSNRNR
jgi:hypothetical protein